MQTQLEFTRIDEPLVRHAAAIVKLAAAMRRTIVTAESCTGGLLASVLSDAPGAGTWLQGGFVVYTPQHKIKALGIPEALIERYGTVSAEVTEALAEAALARSGCELAIAITGVAGPECDEKGNPVGLVHLVAAGRDGTMLHEAHRFGDIGRGGVRYQAVMKALTLASRALVK